ncbi:MAG: Na(+)/H(+) antiporter subunit D [Chromatiales bacterium]|nr:Na(+)/H(+) antiporter subunit D [Chromatiales bacterium]
MTDILIHPGLVLIGGALLVACLRGPARGAVVVLLPLLALALVWQLPDGPAWQFRFLDYTLTPVAGDPLARLFATIFCLAALAGGWFALGQASRLEVPAALVYAGSAIGVVLAGDLLTVLVFWELMAIGSTLVLWSSGTPAAGRASRRYLMLHILGGVVLFAGITGHVAATGDVTFAPMALDSAAQWLILAGVLLNAGAPPLSAWLPDAYPEASWSGTVFLSAFTTKTAVYVLIRGFPGAEILIYLGLCMVFYGIVYALLENDMRRILAYSIVNQVGFMLTGIGIGTEMALNGAAAHAFTHIIYKALLLMSAGSVLYMTGRRKCSELGGLFHSMPVTTACGIVGALSISAFPLTSGFVSKAMISQAAADGHLQTVWLLLVAASAGVFLHAGIKFPWFVFFQEDSGLRPADPPASMRWAMIFLAAICIGLGIWPEALYRLLPFGVAYEPYTAPHVLAQLQLLLFSGLAFFVMLPFLRRTLTITLDTDWAYRQLVPRLAGQGQRAVLAVRGWLAGRRPGVAAGLRALAYRVYGPDGGLARTWPTGSMALWVLVLLLGYLVLFYA